eukprot:scaffold2182_cov118-Isochrysis_galbana.AAC.10
MSAAGRPSMVLGVTVWHLQKALSRRRPATRKSTASRPHRIPDGPRTKRLCVCAFAERALSGAATVACPWRVLSPARRIRAAPS